MFFMSATNENNNEHDNMFNTKFKCEILTLLNLLVANIQVNKNVLKFTNEYIKQYYIIIHNV